MKDSRQVVIQPVLTEKALQLKDKFNQYVFRVAADANKIEIKNALEKRFSVTIKDVRTTNIKPKPRQRFTRTGRVSGFTASWKKAIVTLQEGDTMDFMENL
ncbi:MAG: 50S ribosomal protein L23 [Calditrichia bacterium]